MRRYVATLAMLASIVALALIKEVPLVIGIGLIFVGVIGTADQFVEDYRKNHENIKICKNQAEIESEMKELVKAQGKICIMSRDLSWVNPGIKEQLIKKNKTRFGFSIFMLIPGIILSIILYVRIVLSKLNLFSGSFIYSSINFTFTFSLVKLDLGIE